MNEIGALTARLAIIVAEFNAIARDIEKVGHGVLIVPNEYKSPARGPHRLTAHVVIADRVEDASGDQFRVPSAPGTREYDYTATAAAAQAQCLGKQFVGGIR